MLTYDAGAISTVTPGGALGSTEVVVSVYHTRSYMFSHVPHSCTYVLTREDVYHTCEYMFSRVNICTTKLMLTYDAGAIAMVTPGGALGSTAVVVSVPQYTFTRVNICTTLVNICFYT